MTKITGRCICNDIELVIDETPSVSAECYCGQCQKTCGGVAASVLIFPSQAVNITKGELRFHETLADSGNKIARGFCPNCGTPILSKLEHKSDIVIVKLGAIDKPERFRPTVIFWTSEAHDWNKFPDNTMQFTHNPPASN